MPNYEELLALAREQKEYIVSMRREFHMHPETAYQEVETAARIRRELDAMGIAYTELGTGTVADIIAKEGAPLIALRADIDGLPMQEATGLPFASQNPGRMHACGHDAHTAMLLGAAKILWAHRAGLPVNVRLLFQPAEEGGGGARRMIEGGALENVREIYCLHMGNSLPVGHLATKPGCIHASSDGYVITVHGRSTHGAAPHNGVDAIVIASHIVLALQDIISRETSAFDQAVLTIGEIHGGTARNIVCDKVTLNGTLRTLNDATRTRILGRIDEIARGTAAMYHGSAEISHPQGYCVCMNDEKLTEFAMDTAAKLLGPDAIHLRGHASMGGEDFGFYQQLVPGVKLYLGSGREESNHSVTYMLDEDTLPFGTAYLCALAFGR